MITDEQAEAIGAAFDVLLNAIHQAPNARAILDALTVYQKILGQRIRDSRGFAERRARRTAITVSLSAVGGMILGQIAYQLGRYAGGLP